MEPVWEPLSEGECANIIQWVQTATLCSCLNTHTVFSYLGLGFIFFMVFLLYCFASLDDRKEQEMSVSVVMSTSAFYLAMMYFFLASLTLKYNSSILDDINNDETSSSDYDNEYVRDMDDENDNRHGVSC